VRRVQISMTMLEREYSMHSIIPASTLALLTILVATKIQLWTEGAMGGYTPRFGFRIVANLLNLSGGSPSMSIYTTPLRTFQSSEVSVPV